MAKEIVQTLKVTKRKAHLQCNSFLFIWLFLLWILNKKIYQTAIRGKREISFKIWHSRVKLLYKSRSNLYASFP